MELTLNRELFSENSTIGTLLIDGKKECYVLEDFDRGLDSTMSEAEIKSKKMYGETAIPAGRYEIVINYSNSFKMELPLLLNVKGFSGIRIHVGNTKKDTFGCLLLGRKRSLDYVSDSKVAFKALFPKIKMALLKGEKVFITIKHGNLLA